MTQPVDGTELRQARAEIERLQAENASLRAALEPMARRPGSMQGWDRDTTESIPIERCWAAWRALHEPQAPDVSRRPFVAQGYVIFDERGRGWDVAKVRGDRNGFRHAKLIAEALNRDFVLYPEFYRREE